MKYAFKRAIKLYIEDNNVLCSFRISDIAVVTKVFTVKEFQYIIDHWVLGVSGFETENCGRIWWEYRDCGPRPDCEPMEFVAVSIQGWNFRLSIEEMADAVTQYDKQLKMDNIK